MIPLTEELDVPEEPPLNVQRVRETKTLCTVSELAEDMKKLSVDRCKEMRRKGNELRDQREDKGDQWYEKNRLIPPEMIKLKDFHIEMLSPYNGDDGTQCLGWYQGTIKTILNEKTRRVRIEWDEACLGEGDVRRLDQLHAAKKGGW